MHHALRLEEILSNIFGQCYPPTSISRDQCASCATADLAALARTCRTFKEPALDVLWTELANLSPLARCLPEASHRVYPGYAWYSFNRPLKQAEWDILRSYARRVRSVQDFTKGLNWDSVKALFSPPTPDPIFPNLRVLRWEFIRETFPLMSHLAVPSLTSLDINFVFGDLPPFRSFPDSLNNLCPNIRKFRVHMRRPQACSDEAISTLIRRWTNLQVVYCPYINLDVDTLVHLSYTPSLTNLSFALNAAMTDHFVSSKSTLFFAKLRDLEISSQSLDSVLGLLPCIRLPSLESLSVRVDACPTEHTLRSFMITLQKICSSRSLLSLKLIQTRSPSSIHQDRHQLSLKDIQPCMAFDNLRHLEINTASTMDLADNDLLELTSAWPHLECLLINEEWGWKTERGITPDGLVQLLQKLKSLHHFCLAIDTGSTRTPFPTRQVPVLESAPIFVPREAPLSINVVDSMIQPESVEALSVFFRNIIRQHATVSHLFWNTSAMADHRLDSDISRRLWEDVFVRACGRIKFKIPEPADSRMLTDSR